MLTYADFRQVFYGEPFRPFKIFLKDGRVVERTTPWNMVATRTLGLTVGIPSAREAFLAEETVRFGYEDVLRVEVEGREFAGSQAGSEAA